MILLNKIIIIIALTAIFTITIPAQPFARIENVTFPNLDTINIGLCMAGESLKTSFLIKNLSQNTLKMGSSLPSYTKEVPPGLSGSDFEEFHELFSLPFNIAPNGETIIDLQYYQTPSTTFLPSGKKIVWLRLGLYDPLKFPDPSKPQYDSQLVAYRDFIIIAYKTKQYLDSYDYRFTFDSIYINPLDTIKYPITIQNASNKFLKIDSQSLKILTPIPVDTEISVTGFPLPVSFPANRTAKNWIINYYPKDTLFDFAILKLAFKPDPVTYPDSINYIIDTIIGHGVEQKLEVTGSSVNYTFNTVDFGDIPVDSSKEAIIFIRNNGNIPFGVLSQKIFKQDSDLPENSYNIIKTLAEDGKNIQPKEIDTIKIKFTAKSQGFIYGRYVIESDILNRKIYGTPKQNQFCTFYFKARAVQPKIALTKDTVDFGKIVIHQDCPTNRDTLIYIANEGNVDLVIYDMKIEPMPAAFSDSLGDLPWHISPGSQKLFKISFSTNVQQEYHSILKIVTNCNFPLDTIRINLYAKGVEPLLTDISIPKINSKPGRKIIVPILAEKNKLINAKTFKTTLIYDSTLIGFADKIILNTASENADTVIAREDSSGSKLYLEIRTPPAANIHFLPSDTLILLKFNTYLGDKISTPISFADIAFGDGICSNVLTTNPLNGSLTIDSVCGLEYIAVPLTQKKYSFEKIFPNPANDKLEIEYSIPIRLKVEISIYNSFGNEVSRPVDNELPIGDYQMTIPVLNLAPGMYYCEMRSGIFKKTLPFVVNK